VIWAFSRSLVAVLRALEVAYDLPQNGWWRRRLKAVGLALVTILTLALLLVVVIVGPLLGGMRALFSIADIEQAVEPLLWLRFPLAFGLLVAWAWMIYHLGPNHQSPWRWDLPGALLTGFLWLLASVGFRLYLEVAGGFNQVFGLLGGALIVMVWVYLLSIALLTGGELNAVLGKRRRLARPVGKA
jgi:membrane protein